MDANKREYKFRFQVIRHNVRGRGTPRTSCRTTGFHSRPLAFIRGCFNPALLF